MWRLYARRTAGTVGSHVRTATCSWNSAPCAVACCRWALIKNLRVRVTAPRKQASDASPGGPSSQPGPPLPGASSGLPPGSPVLERSPERLAALRRSILRLKTTKGLRRRLLDLVTKAQSDLRRKHKASVRLRLERLADVLHTNRKQLGLPPRDVKSLIGETQKLAATLPAPPTGPQGPQQPGGPQGPQQQSGPQGPQGSGPQQGPQQPSGPQSGSTQQGPQQPSGPQSGSTQQGPQQPSGPQSGSTQQGPQQPSGPQSGSAQQGPQQSSGQQSGSTQQGPQGSSGQQGSTGPQSAQAPPPTGPQSPPASSGPQAPPQPTGPQGSGGSGPQGRQLLDGSDLIRAMLRRLT